MFLTETVIICPSLKLNKNNMLDENLIHATKNKQTNK